MASARLKYTNWSKGELSPLMEGRPDLAVYPEGAKELTNWFVIRQGGVMRRPGLRFVREVKRSDKDTILLPFEFSVDDAFIIEMGETYARFYKNRENIATSSGGPPVEVVTPYAETDLRSIHFTQAADQLYLFHPNFQQQRLSRVLDTSWFLNPIIYRPAPSFETDTNISGGATLTPGAVTGNSVVFTASAAVFLEGDVGRLIISGAARAIITGFGASAGDTGSPNTHVRADILDAFPDVVSPVGPDVLSSWKLRLSPQVALDADKKEPVGAQVTMVASKAAFRDADIGKFIVLYGGLIKITIKDSVTQIRGELLSVLSTALDNPASSPAGAWTMEESSWTTINGFPRTGEFVQGRLVQASTKAQPTTWWMSASDDFDNYAIGVAADTAIEDTINKKRVNRIEWIADHFSMFLGTAGNEFIVESGKADSPFGGDVVPSVKPTSYEGGAPVQPIILNRQLIFLDRSRKKIFTLLFDIYTTNYQATEATGAAEHITGTGIRLGAIAYTTRPDPRVYFVREDGQLVALTFFIEEKVVGFTRIVTDGTFESVAVIPQPGGAPDQVWVIVKRTINGQVKRYVEFFEAEAKDSVPGLGTFIESTGYGQSWFKGFVAAYPEDDPVSQEWNSNYSIPIFISDTVVFKFHSGTGGLVYRKSIDSGITWGSDQTINASGFDLRAIEAVDDPDDTPPEHKVFIALASNKVWVSRNVLQPNPTLATWAKINITNTNVLGMSVRGKQVLVYGVDSVSPTRLSLHCSNDFGITFPNVVVISDDTGDASHIQWAASPGTNIWVILNPFGATGFIYRSIDNGVSWVTVAAGLTGAATDNEGCLINLNDTIMIAIFRGTVYRSTNAGLTWTQVLNLSDNILSIGYFGNGIISGLSKATFTGSSGNIEVRSIDYGLTWNLAPVDAGFNLPATRRISKMAVRGARGLVVGHSGAASSCTWYNPSILVETSPGDPIRFEDRPWNSLQTDSALVYVSETPTKIVPGLTHLEGETVEVVADGAFRGTFIVSQGSITVNEEAQSFEVGLHYGSKGVTMRATVPGQTIEGVPTSWNTLFARLDKTIGGTINGKPIPYPPSPVGTLVPFTGDRKVVGTEWSDEIKTTRITFEQNEPYPMTLLMLFGTLSIGGHD